MEVLIIAIGLLTATIWAAYHVWNPEPWKREPRLFEPAPATYRSTFYRSNQSQSIHERDTLPCDMRPFLQEDPGWIKAVGLVNCRTPPGPQS